MGLAAIGDLIESHIKDTDAMVSQPRTVGQDREDGHYTAAVVSPAFKGKSLVQQHQFIYDALDDHMTADIYAMELKTYTPKEYAAREG